MQLSGRGALRPERCSCLLLLTVLDIVASWDYSTNGGDSWASLGACGGQLGGVQSPVDLPSGAPVVEGKSVILKYPRFENSVQLYHNGYSIAMTLPEAYKAGFGVAPSRSLLSRPGAEAYRLWQVNFHAPSEHTFEGKKMPLEVQLVHQRVSGGDEVAILVVLFTDAGDKRSNFLDAVIGDGLPSASSDEKSINGPASKVPLDFAELARGSPYFQYEGSLTVPPCSPKVRYVVRTEPALAASTQLQQFETILKDTCSPNGNYRTQPLQGIGGPDISMLASVDITSSPEVQAKAEFKEPPGGRSKMAGIWNTPQARSCMASTTTIADTFDHLNAGDTRKLRDIKARYNQAKLSLRSAQSASSAAERNLANAQKMYDSATGYCGCEVKSKWYCNHEPLGSSCLECPANPTMCASITTGMPAAGEESCRAYCFSQGAAGAQLQASGASKADLFWRVHAAKQNLVDTSRRLTDADHEFSQMLREAMGTVLIECILSKLKNKPRGGKPSAVMKELVYENEVKLPQGPAASPFSSPMGVEVSDVLKAKSGGAVPTKLAPNLHQQDAPPDSIPMPMLKDAEKPAAGPHDHPAWLSHIIATMTLPIPVKDLGDTSVFSSDFAGALAASVAVSPDRIHVTEIHKKVVQDIALDQEATERKSAVALLDGGVLPSEKQKPSLRHRHGFLHASKLEH